MIEPITAQTPEVWAFCNYTPGMGGYRAFMGVAEQFSARTGLQLRPMEYKIIAADFRSAVAAIVQHMPERLKEEPREGSRLWWRRDKALRQVATELVFRKHGYPTGILMPFDHKFIGMPTQNPDSTAFQDRVRLTAPRNTFLADHLAITHWDSYLPDEYRGLAPHSLTRAELASEAERFYPTLKADGKPVIAIILANGFMGRHEEPAIKKIIAENPNARFVLSSSPRTIPGVLYEEAEVFMRWLNPEQRDSFISFDFGKDPQQNNPYKALITLADHMIIIGQSESMISERLFAGRTVHYNYGHSEAVIIGTFRDLATTGKIKHFPVDRPFTSEIFEPIDTTRMITDTLIENFTSHQQPLSEEIEPNPAVDRLAAIMRRSVEGVVF